MLFRYIFPSVLVAIAIVLFFSYIQPTYHAIGELRIKRAAQEEALANVRQLDETINQLTTTYDAISEEDRTRLLKMMPDDVNNIPLILDTQGVAKRFGLVAQDIKFDVPKSTTKGAQSASAAVAGQKDYGIFDLEFSVASTYGNFTQFLNELEKSLRIIDITSIIFSTDKISSGTGIYKFTVKVRTYWLKN